MWVGTGPGGESVTGVNPSSHESFMTGVSNRPLRDPVVVLPPWGDGRDGNSSNKSYPHVLGSPLTHTWEVYLYLGPTVVHKCTPTWVQTSTV